MIYVIILVVLVVCILAFWLFKHYGSQQAKADRLYKKIKDKEDDLSFVIDKLALAIKLSNYNIRDKLDIQRMCLIKELDKLRDSYEHLTGVK